MTPWGWRIRWSPTACEDSAILTLLRRYGTLLGFAAILALFWINLPDTFMTPRNWLTSAFQVHGCRGLPSIGGSFKYSAIRPAAVSRVFLASAGLP